VTTNQILVGIGLILVLAVGSQALALQHQGLKVPGLVT
jgi:hypothetical protein